MLLFRSTVSAIRLPVQGCGAEHDQLDFLGNLFLAQILRNCSPALGYTCRSELARASHGEPRNPHVGHHPHLHKQGGDSGSFLLENSRLFAW